jgi:N-acetylglucosaminyldiphosphoundecaprenol N-acetyl-beta-D-mannosaminyltransferase
MTERVNVLGVGVSAINMDMAVETMSRWISGRERNYVCITGVHGVMECQQDPELLTIHNRSGLVTPDGMPLVWLSWLSGCRHVDRVYGPDLMTRVSAESPARGWRHFYYGGGEGVVEQLTARMRLNHPGLQVVGTYRPPFRPLTVAEEQEVIGLINDSGADIVWVGLSTPKQERWMARFRDRIESPVMVGVGAAFDFNAGLKVQAPRWIQRSGLEWAFRMATEPRRLATRYLRNNPRFLLRIAQQRLGLRDYPAVH